MERFVKGKRQKRSRRNKLWFLNTNPNSTCLAFRPLTNVSDAVLKSPEKSFASSPWFGMYLFCQIKNGLSFCDNWEPKILLHLIRQPVCLFTLPSFGWAGEHHLIKRYHLNLLLNNVFSQQHSNVVGCLFLSFIVSHLDGESQFFLPGDVVVDCLCSSAERWEGRRIACCSPRKKRGAAFYNIKSFHCGDAVYNN